MSTTVTDDPFAGNTIDQPVPARPAPFRVASIGSTIPTGPRAPWMSMPPGQLYNTDMGPAGNIIKQVESGGRNIPELHPTNDDPASGLLQISKNTWSDFAPGVGANRWNVAMDAYPQVQLAVAENIPLSRWALSTQNAVLRAYPWANKNMTLGQINRQASASQGIQQRYIPAGQTEEYSNRPPSQWMRAPEGGYASGPGHMPEPYDVPPLMQAAALAVPILSLFARGSATPMLTAWGSFAQGWQQGQLLKRELAKNQWQDSLKETVARLEQEGIDYGDVFSAYADNPTALANALSGVAAKYNDAPVQAALAQGGPAAVEKLLQRRDQHFTDLDKTKSAIELQRLRIERERQAIELDRSRERRLTEAAQTTEELRSVQIELDRVRTEALRTKSDADKKKVDQLQQKRDQLRERLRRQGIPEERLPSATVDSSEQTAETTDETDDSTDTAAPPRPAQSDESEATPKSAPGAAPRAAAAAQPTPQPDEEIPQRTQIASIAPISIPTTPRPPQPVPVQQVAERKQTPVEQWSDQLASGDTPQSLQGVDKEALPYIQERAAEKRAALADLAGTPDLTGPELVRRVRDVSPLAGDTLQGLLERRAGAPETITSPRMAQYWQTLENLARKADPTWDPGQFKAVDQFRNPNGRTQYALGRVASLVQMGAQVLEDLKRLPDDKDALSRALKKFNAGTLEGSDIYSNLFIDWQGFAIESNIVRTGGGSVTESEQIIRAIPEYGSKEQFRGAVKHDAISAAARIEHWRTQWRQFGRKDEMPGDEAEATRTLRWIGTLDTRSGVMKGPGEVPDMLKDAMPVETKGFDPDKFLRAP